jgi:hypothetical protein
MGRLLVEFLGRGCEGNEVLRRKTRKVFVVHSRFQPEPARRRKMKKNGRKTAEKRRLTPQDDSRKKSSPRNPAIIILAGTATPNGIYFPRLRHMKTPPSPAI